MPVWSSRVRVRKALEACAAWVAEPSPEREAAWEGTFRDGLPTWVVMPAWDTWRPSESVTAAARIIREARVREVAARAVLEVL